MPELADVEGWKRYWTRFARGPALMDQSLLAGLGNELSDEIPWRARVRPQARVPGLSDEQVERIHAALRRVLASACRHGRTPERGRWLNAVRHDEEPHCPRCGAELRRERVAGRTSCWCARCQRGAGSR